MLIWLLILWVVLSLATVPLIARMLHPSTYPEPAEHEESPVTGRSHRRLRRVKRVGVALIGELPVTPRTR